MCRPAASKAGAEPADELAPPAPRAGRCRGSRAGCRFCGSFCRVTASIGTPAACVGLHELHQVVGVGLVDPGVVDQPAADQRVVGLHPGRRAPRRGDHGQVGVERQRLAQQRQDPRPVVGDGEVLHRVVRLAGGHVVVGVEVGPATKSEAPIGWRRTDSPSPGRANRSRHRGVAGRRVAAGQDRRRGVGDRRAEAAHGLVATARVDRDRQPVRAPGLKAAGSPGDRRCAPSGVVIHTRTGGAAAAGRRRRGGDHQADAGGDGGEDERGRRCERRTTAGPPGPTLCPIRAVL